MPNLTDYKSALSQLANDDFLQVLCAPLLFWGVLGGGVLLALGLWWLKDGRVQVLALAMIMVSSLCIWPVNRWRPAKVPRNLTTGAGDWKDQTVRLKQTQWIFYTMAGLAGLTLALRGRGKAGDVLQIAAVVGSMVTAATGLHLVDRESRIHHPEAIPERGDPRL